MRIRGKRVLALQVRAAGALLGRTVTEDVVRLAGRPEALCLVGLLHRAGMRVPGDAAHAFKSLSNLIS